MMARDERWWQSILADPEFAPKGNELAEVPAGS